MRQDRKLARYFIYFIVAVFALGGVIAILQAYWVYFLVALGVFIGVFLFLKLRKGKRIVETYTVRRLCPNCNVFNTLFVEKGERVKGTIVCQRCGRKYKVE